MITFLKRTFNKKPTAIFFEDHKPALGDFLNDTLQGLQATPKKMQPHYLYDERGAKLFEDICQTEEYYITRTEMALIGSIGANLATRAGAHVRLVEFGMGEGIKARQILSLLQQPYGFVGIDISREQLQTNIDAMARSFPDLEIGGICADFFNLPDVPPAKENIYDVGFFPGSTIGNYTPTQQQDLLGAMKRALCGKTGKKTSLIIGVDLKKSEAQLCAAYNDRQGATAAFSLNLLARMKRELNAKVNIDGFKHEAVYKTDESKIEICLRSLREQAIKIGEHEIPIGKGEPIYTENAYKFTPAQFQALAASAGWVPKEYWCDDKQLFSIHWLDSE